jgi:hypothetical protein
MIIFGSESNYITLDIDNNYLFYHVIIENPTDKNEKLVDSKNNNILPINSNTLSDYLKIKNTFENMNQLINTTFNYSSVFDTYNDYQKYILTIDVPDPYYQIYLDYPFRDNFSKIIRSKRSDVRVSQVMDSNIKDPNYMIKWNLMNIFTNLVNKKIMDENHYDNVFNFHRLSTKFIYSEFIIDPLIKTHFNEVKLIFKGGSAMFTFYNKIQNLLKKKQEDDKQRQIKQTEPEEKQKISKIIFTRNNDKRQIKL